MIAKLNSKNQITLPRNLRQKLNVKAGDSLLMDIQDGVIVLIPQPESYTDRLQGLHSEIWKDLDARKYLEEERISWKR
ncbi:MAG: hypothetical protein RL536_87 [Candidatus Parcubacteria bacterium]|jgi:AbrB family looped-hinge helix DNA binding protein